MSETRDPAVPSKLLTPEEFHRLAEAVRQAELGTSGEIRVRIERFCGDDPLGRAKELLEELNMVHTRDRTGVLLYVAVADRRFAVYGDEAIHRVIGEAGWAGICERLGARFAAAEYAEGLCEAVAAVGRVLARSFPIARDDRNELPDEPSVED